MKTKIQRSQECKHGFKVAKLQEKKNTGHKKGRSEDKGRNKRKKRNKREKQSKIYM